MRRFLLCSAAVLALTGAAMADGQDDQSSIDLVKKTEAVNAKLFAFDYGIPSSPAIELAGLGGDKIKTSTSLKPFVLALPGLLNGTAETAALDISPAALYDSNATPTDDWWHTDPFERIATKARLGVVLYRGDDGGGDAAKVKPSRLAFGISAGLLPSSDPLLVGDRGGWSDTFAASMWGQCLLDKDNLALLSVNISDAEAAEANRTTLKIMLKQMGDSPMLSEAALTRLEKLEHTLDIGAADADARAAKRAEFKTHRERIGFDIGLNDATVDTSHRAQSDAKAREVVTACIKNASAAAEHAFDLQVGLGAVFSGKPGAFSDFNETAAAMWASLRVPLRFMPMSKALTDKYKPWDYCGEDYKPGFADMLTSCWTFGGSGRVSLGEVVQTGNATTPAFKANILEGWVGLERVSTASKIGGYVGYLDQSAVHASDAAFAKHGIRYYFSAAIPLNGIPGLDGVLDGTWLEASYGAAHGSVTTLDDKVAMLTLAFAPPSLGSTFVSK